MKGTGCADSTVKLTLPQWHEPSRCTVRSWPSVTGRVDSHDAHRSTEDLRLDSGPAGRIEERVHAIPSAQARPGQRAKVAENRCEEAEPGALSGLALRALHIDVHSHRTECIVHAGAA